MKEERREPFAGFFALVALVRVTAMGMLFSSLSDMICVLPPH